MTWPQASPGLGLERVLLRACVYHSPLPLGCVEFLSRPTMAFVRLREAVELDAVLEVPVPVRFLFLLLGPSSANMDYHEIGRSISTLMSDKVSPARTVPIPGSVPNPVQSWAPGSTFPPPCPPCPTSNLLCSLIPVLLWQQFHEAAYLADEREDLLTAINAFLDCSVVLPPSEVQGEELLRSVAHFQRQMLKKREEQGRLLPPGVGLEPKSAQEKGTLWQHRLHRAAQGRVGGRAQGYGHPDGGLVCSIPADGRGGGCSRR